MLEGPLIFVDIDTQRDFLEPTGALYVPGSTDIILNLARLTTFARKHGVSILATACSHSVDDPELTRFPPHCMAGTARQERVEATHCVDSVVLEFGQCLTGELPHHLTLLKHELDLFSRPDATALIAQYNRDHPTFVVYGVATDYCVLAAVNGLLERHCRVAIVADAVRAIDPLAESDIFDGWARRGVLFTVTDVTCQENIV